MAAVAERAVLSTLEAGCTAPVAAYSEWVEQEGKEGTEQRYVLRVFGGVFAMNGSRKLVRSGEAVFDIPDPTADEGFPTAQEPRWRECIDSARTIGTDIGRALLEDGAAELVAEAE